MPVNEAVPGAEKKRREVTPTELLEIRESAWSHRLGGVSLVAENLAEAEFAEQTLRVIGRKYAQAPVRGRARILRQWPAVQVMSTVSVAAEFYAHGTFWPKLTAIVGGGGQGLQTEWGNAFLDNLRTLGLPDFSDIEDPGAKFVGPILMHSGVPTYCLGDYFRLVTERRARAADLTPDEFVAWAASRAVEDRLYDVDKPVARFLRYGGDFAIDVTDRVFELLDVIAAGGTGEEVPLPERFRLEAQSLRTQGALEPVSIRRGTSGLETAQGPVLVLDPYGRGPMLRLPAVDTAPGEHAVWSVTFDTHTEQVQSQALWPGEPAPATEVAVPRPARTVTAAMLRRPDLAVTLPLVDDKDPLLVFTEDGRLLPSGLPLPGAAVWLLIPGETDDLIIHGERRILASGALPPGWAGWTLVLMDLGGVGAVRFSRSDRSRSVRRVSSARIRTGEPIAGLRSRAGSPVFAEPPTIELPSETTSETSWIVTITDGRGVNLVDGRPLRPGDDEHLMWQEVPRPLLGRYRIRVRGPWGRGAARDVVVAEGVRVEAAPGWRRICARGLVPATINVRTPAGMIIDRPTFSLAEEQVECPVSLAAHGAQLVLAVRLPHMTMSYQSTEQSTAASIRPVQLYSEDVRASAGTLSLDLDTAAEPTLHVLAGRGCTQELAPIGGSRNGIYRFNLAQLSDTLAAHPRVRLALDDAGELIIAELNPRTLYTGLDLVDGTIHVHDAVEVDGLAAIAYPARAPWRGGTVLGVHAGSATLPPELTQAGPIVVMVRIDDPWVPTPVPAWPRPRSAALLEAPGWVTSDDQDEAELSRYLAGAGDFPREPDPAWVWAIAARLPWIGVGERFHEVSDACLKALQADPVDSLLALENSELEPDRIPEALVRSGLVWVPAVLGSRIRVRWTRTSVLPATLLTATRLVDEAARDADELSEARAICGDVLDALLTGTDPFAGAGRYDVAADRYVLLDPETRAEFHRILALVPQGLLDRDTRTQAALDLLDCRYDAPEKLYNGVAKTLKEAREVLRRAGDQRGMDAVASRMHPTRDAGWRAYPALSLALAWVARRAAHGDRLARHWIKGQQRLWTDLARLAPGLVTIDLILAELLVAAADAQRLKEET